MDAEDVWVRAAPRGWEREVCVWAAGLEPCEATAVKVVLESEAETQIHGVAHV